MADLRQVARQDAQKYGLDPATFERQINAESNFDPNAVSPAGAVGDAQIMPGTAAAWHVDPHDPFASLDAAAKHMAAYVKQFGSYRAALVAYNAGPGAVGKRLPAETVKYINKILGSGKGQRSAGGGTTSYLSATSQTDGQQAAIDALLAHAASPGSSLLQGFVRNLDSGLYTTTTPAARASYSLPGTSPSPVAPGGHIYNAKNLGRTDMGVDFTGKGAIPALDAAIVTRVQRQNTGTGWPGAGDGGRGSRGAIVVYKLTSGPNQGKYVYVAENFDPSVKVGQRLQAGDVIGHARGAFPFTESGFAANEHGTTLASATTGYTEGQQTQAGKRFLAYLKSLGLV